MPSYSMYFFAHHASHTNNILGAFWLLYLWNRARYVSSSLSPDPQKSSQFRYAYDADLPWNVNPQPITSPSFLDSIGRKKSDGDVVLLAACEDSARAYEDPDPDDSERRVRGLLTLVRPVTLLSGAFLMQRCRRLSTALVRTISPLEPEPQINDNISRNSSKTYIQWTTQFRNVRFPLYT